MAQATNSLPLNPTLTFKHISVHVIHVLARQIARNEVKAQLRADGVRVQYVSPREVNERATAYLHDHPEVWREALTRAHRIDEKEGQRKARQKLRREELARRRQSPPVSPSDHANAGTEKTRVFRTTSAIFSSSCLLIAS